VSFWKFSISFELDNFNIHSFVLLLEPILGHFLHKFFRNTSRNLTFNAL
jgi:hypothetical protein